MNTMSISSHSGIFKGIIIYHIVQVAQELGEWLYRKTPSMQVPLFQLQIPLNGTFKNILLVKCTVKIIESINHSSIVVNSLRSL